MLPVHALIPEREFRVGARVSTRIGLYHRLYPLVLPFSSYALLVNKTMKIVNVSRSRETV